MLRFRVNGNDFSCISCEIWKYCFRFNISYRFRRFSRTTCPNETTKGCTAKGRVAGCFMLVVPRALLALADPVLCCSNKVPSLPAQILYYVVPPFHSKVGVLIARTCACARTTCRNVHETTKRQVAGCLMVALAAEQCTAIECHPCSLKTCTMLSLHSIPRWVSWFSRFYICFLQDYWFSRAQNDVSQSVKHR